MTHNTDSRMARTTWWAGPGRATPCRRAAGNQLSPAMGARRMVVLSTLLLLGACARTDVGAPCHLENAQGAELTQQPGRQYLYLGSSECQSFACLGTASSGGGYCSQACSGAGGSCPSSRRGGRGWCGWRSPATIPTAPGA